MGKKRITKEDRYNQLLECATTIFSKKGYNSATTKDISKAASISEKMIYIHFKNKQELFLKCLNRIEEELRINFRKIIQQYHENSMACLEQIGVFFFEYLNKRKYAAGLLSLHAREVNNKAIKNEYKKMIKMYVDTIEITIRKGVEKGDLPSDLDPRAAAWTFVGSYNTFLSMKEFSIEEFNRDFIRKVIDTVLRFSL